MCIAIPIFTSVASLFRIRFDDAKIEKIQKSRFWLKFSQKRYSFIRFAPSGAADHRQAVERSETPVNEQVVERSETPANNKQ